jgi:ergothioneine biosynthesis protein EgtB
MQRAALASKFHLVRDHSLVLTASLTPEDQNIQSMPDASPVKWHVAHTTWFFETLVLRSHQPGYRVFDEHYLLLFNSYYESLGPRHPRPQRGVLSRPSLEQVHEYRRHVDAALASLIETCPPGAWAAVKALVTLGLHHEQQHQELMLTDVLHMFSCNPLLPAYAAKGLSLALPIVKDEPDGAGSGASTWRDIPGGLVGIGHEGPDFCFDNETPRHDVLLRPFQLADRLVTCGEYAEFIADGGYQRHELWLSEGWATVQSQGWRAPLYWIAPGDPRATSHDWQVYGLAGVQPFNGVEPVSQLSFFEAAAYAHWAGARLPTEFEWEAAFDMPGIKQMTARAWQWTRSSYDPYPGFKPFEGQASEYNGKFMVGQLVLRGSSWATPAGHVRPTYRNFFPPAARWQFSGLRLARDLPC